jgi:hypothetical protein
MTVRIGRPSKVWVAALACVGTLGFGATAFGGASAGAAVRPTANKNAPLFVDVETATSGEQLANVFALRSKVEFWVKVFSASTGDVPLSSTALKSVIVAIPGAPSLHATYGKHGTDSFWVATWTIPASYKTGVVNYTVTARANNGQVGTYVPFNIAPSSLTVAA